MMECFRTRRLSPCPDGSNKERMIHHEKKQLLCLSSDGQNDDQEEMNKGRLASNEREVVDREHDANDAVEE